MCGSQRGFRELGEIEITAETSRNFRAVVWGADGLVAKPGGEWDDEGVWPLDDDQVRPTGVECRSCGATRAEIEDLATRPLRAGQKVNLPDGRTAEVDRFDFTRHEDGRETMRLYAGGEWWEMGEVEPWQPNPAQLSLAAG